MAPDRRLNVREWGDRGDPRVVCWPGLNLHAHAHFDEAGPILAERFGLHVLAVEPPGWTSPPLSAAGYRPSALARLVAPLLAPRGVFLGWSWGGTIGAHVGALAPEGLAALVLLDAGFADAQDLPGFRDRSLEELEAEVRASQVGFTWDDYLASARGRVRSWRPALEARARAGVHDDGGSIAPLLAPETLAAAFRGVTEERPGVVLGDIRCPVLLVAAEETLEQVGEAPLQRFRSALPDAEVVTLASSHDLLADALEETVAAVGAFVRSL